MNPERLLKTLTGAWLVVYVMEFVTFHQLKASLPSIPAPQVSTSASTALNAFGVLFLVGTPICASGLFFFWR
jgi:hypothetical protein